MDLTLLKRNIELKLFTLFNISMIYSLSPKIIHVTDNDLEVSIPLNRSSRNHVKSMYFGALSAGADLCIGLLARHHIESSGKKIILVFKDFKADFKRLARGDVHFFCNEGPKVKALVEKVIATGTRQNATIHGYATCPKISDEVVMDFDLTLSLK